MLMTWFPMLLQRPDGSQYSLFAYYERRVGEGFDEMRSQAEELTTSGDAHRFAAVTPALEFRDDNRRFIGGSITLHDSDGSARVVQVAPVSDTGFHLGTGGYFGWKGRMHGQWSGELAVDGEHITGCDQPEVAREVHQLRDLLVRVDDPVGGGAGLGNLETMAIGAFPELGLTQEASFL
jgi:hypothetical protein